MPRKKKPAKSTALLLDEAMRDLREAQKRVAFYKSRLEPLHQQLIAEMAEIGSPPESFDEGSWPGTHLLKSDESGPPAAIDRETA